jgi:hypothetical protein
MTTKDKAVEKEKYKQIERVARAAEKSARTFVEKNQKLDPEFRIIKPICC